MLSPRNIFRTARALLASPRPLVLFYKPTARCDCRCRFCDSWVGQPDHDDVLPSADVLSLLDRAAASGFTTYTVWGGEPFIVPALPEWLAYARARGLETIVCTSGSRLEERAAEFTPHVRKLLLSLEAADERQDKLRGTPGLFKKVVAGLDEWRRRRGGPVTLWSNLSRENADQVGPIARFAAEHGAEVEFFPAAVYPGFNEKLVLSAEERREVFDRCAAEKRAGLPVRSTYWALELMGSGRPFRCNIPRLSVQVFADGKIYPCEPRVIPGLAPYGDINSTDLASFHRRPDFIRAGRELAACNRCLLPCVGNVADSLIAQSLRKFLPGL